MRHTCTFVRSFIITHVPYVRVWYRIPYLSVCTVSTISGYSLPGSLRMNREKKGTRKMSRRTEWHARGGLYACGVIVLLGTEFIAMHSYITTRKLSSGITKPRVKSEHSNPWCTVTVLNQMWNGTPHKIKNEKKK